MQPADTLVDKQRSFRRGIARQSVVIMRVVRQRVPLIDHLADQFGIGPGHFPNIEKGRFDLFRGVSLALHFLLLLENYQRYWFET